MNSQWPEREYYLSWFDKLYIYDVRLTGAGWIVRRMTRNA